jgi:hypothetical protein
MATRTWAGGTHNWSDTAAWVESIVPTAADDVVMNVNTTGTLTVDGTSGSPSLCRSFSATGFTGTVSMGATSVMTIGDGTVGAFTLISGMTFTPNAASTINFASAASGNNITCAGKTLGIVNFSGAGTFVLQDTFLAAGAVTQTAGTFNANNQNLTIKSWTSNSGTRVITMGSGTWTINGTSGTVFSISTNVGLTLNSNTSKIYISDTGASAKTVGINAGSQTYYDLEIAGAAGNGIVTINAATGGGTTLRSIVLHPDCSIKFTSGRTIVLTTAPSWAGTSGHTITIAASTGGSAATLSVASGVAICDYLSITDSTATGGAKFYAGSHSTNVSGNTGWTFGDPTLITGAITEHSDSMTSAAIETFSASGGVTEARDVAAAVSKLTYSASGAITEHTDTVAGVAVERCIITSSITEHADTATGSVAKTIRISAAITEHADTVSGVLIERYSATGAVTEARDVCAGIVTATFSLTGAITERADTAHGAASISFNISGSVTENRDTVSGAISVFDEVHGLVIENEDIAAATVLNWLVVNPIELTGYILLPETKGYAISKVSMTGAE